MKLKEEQRLTIRHANLQQCLRAKYETLQCSNMSRTMVQMQWI